MGYHLGRINANYYDSKVIIKAGKYGFSKKISRVERRCTGVYCVYLEM